jgi:hypothetical protein
MIVGKRDVSVYLGFGIDDAKPGHCQVAVLRVRESSRHLERGGVRGG